MVKWLANNITTGDPDKAQFTPSAVIRAIKHVCGKIVTKHMLTHYVKTTIGRSAEPAAGRGTQTLCSARDIVLIIEGIHLLNLGLAPFRVQTIVDTIRSAWTGPLRDPPKRYLQAGITWDAKFRAFLWLEPSDLFLEHLGNKWRGGPVIAVDLAADLGRIVNELEPISAELYSKG